MPKKDHPSTKWSGFFFYFSESCNFLLESRVFDDFTRHALSKTHKKIRICEGGFFMLSKIRWSEKLYLLKLLSRVDQSFVQVQCEAVSIAADTIERYLKINKDRRVLHGILSNGKYSFFVSKSFFIAQFASSLQKLQNKCYLNKLKLH